MTPLSRCELLDRSRVLFRGKAFFCLVSFLVVVVGLAMGQVHLRFLARDLEIETGKLQRAREDLQNRKKVVVSEVERLKRTRRSGNTPRASSGCVNVRRGKPARLLFPRKWLRSGVMRRTPRGSRPMYPRKTGGAG